MEALVSLEKEEEEEKHRSPKWKRVEDLVAIHPLEDIYIYRWRVKTKLPLDLEKKIHTLEGQLG